MLKPCLECPTLVRNSSRCLIHRKQLEARRGTSTQRGYDGQYRRLRAAAIAAQPWCSRCLHPGSVDNPLTADHQLALHRGGRSAASNLQVLCRVCNSAKRDR